MGKAQKIGAMAAMAALAVLVAPPAAQAERPLGGGAFLGTVTYDSSVPWTSCASTDADVSITAEVVMTDGGFQYVGPVVFTGRSTSIWCTSASSGGMWVPTWSVSGTSTEGAVLDCPHMGGLGGRQLTWFVTGTGGACTLDGATVGNLAFWFNGTSVPTGPAADGLRSETVTGYVTASSY